MTSFFSASTLQRQAFALLALVASHAVQAEAFQFVTPQVTIDFDTDGFAFSRDVPSFGGTVTESISPSWLSYSAVGNGVMLDFNGFMAVQASSYTNFSPETLSGTFSALFNFTPQAGYAITGYTITYHGNFSIESPGQVTVTGPGNGVPTIFDPSGSFTETGVEIGPASPLIQGQIFATAEVNTIQVYDGTYYYIDHYEQVLDYCETDDPFTCYYREEPVYVGEPQYHDEMDLGDASIDLRTITVQAIVVAVPEPASWALCLAGLGVAGWRLRGRTRQAVQV